MSQMGEYKQNKNLNISHADMMNVYFEHQLSRFNIIKKAIVNDNVDAVEAIQQIENKSLEVFNEYLKSQKELNSLYIRVNKLSSQQVQTIDSKVMQSELVKQIEQENQTAQEKKEQPSKRIINRYEVEVVNRANQKKRNYDIPSGGKVIIICDKTHDIDTLFCKGNMSTQIITLDETQDGLKKAFDCEIAGVIGIAGSNLTEEQGINYLYLMFLAAKLLNNKFEDCKISPFYSAITFLGGKFGFDSNSKNVVVGSVSGLLKTAAREWKQKASVHCLDVWEDITNSQLNTILEDEIEYGDTVEVGYTSPDNRVVLKLIEMYEQEKAKKTPNENDVFVVTGGGHGITALCMLKLAKQYPCNFVLLGRTELIEEPAKLTGVNEISDIQKVLIDIHKANKEKVNLAQIKVEAKKIISQREIKDTLQKLLDVGAKGSYYTCDVTNIASVKDVVKQCKTQYGHVTGIIYGAGVISDNYIKNKSLEEFKKVFLTKYKGLYNLIHAIDNEELQYLVLHSSVAGYFGNVGQCDYACGNEYLNHFARSFKHSHKTATVMAVNWGPWNGGMVSQGLREAMLKQGINLIEPEIGSNYFSSIFTNEHREGLCQMIINDSDVLEGGLV